ncbi:TadE/TadG family type IV pilus assembly protein [Desulfotruncus alcoholivorax]|uniref:TadE/TadG family type IV pilus assembly protein n=1 Tax=Desulfotruncus alcoholivorax TaxID=265477 RepID=UPI0004228DFC|nr:TadE family protein [Desulfotruncus alcoholivorax]
MRYFIKLRGDNRGQALVEFALVLPILILLLMAIFEFGNIFHSYLLITTASREGARMGVVGHSDAEITQRIEEVCSTLDTSKMTINIEPHDPNYRNRGVPLTVEVDYENSLLTPLLRTFLPDPLTIRARSIMRIE